MPWFGRKKKTQDDFANSIEVHSHAPSPVLISFDEGDGEGPKIENPWVDQRHSKGRFRRLVGGRGAAAARSDLSGNIQHIYPVESTISQNDECCCAVGDSMVDSLYTEDPTTGQIGDQEPSVPPLPMDPSGGAAALDLRSARRMESIRDGEESEDESSRKKHCLANKSLSRPTINKACVLITCLCFLIAAFVATLVTLIKRNKARSASLVGGTGNSTSAESDNIFNTTASGDNGESLNPNDNQDETDGVDDTFVYTSATALSDQESPQWKAMDWLLNNDESRLFLSGGASRTEIQERFGAATLYFATKGNGWSSDLGFLSGGSICSWNDGESLGIFCNEMGAAEKINLASNNLSGSMPNELKYFSSLKTLYLYYNELTGSIPDLSPLTSLEEIDLDTNSLAGDVPGSLFNLPNIRYLYLLYNKGLTGSIPNIQDQSRLERISLFQCSFFGSLPSSLGKASGLELLQLKNNAFTGTIPSEIFGLPKLETLGLHGNRLTGFIPSIPESLGTTLVSLSLGGNQLQGPIPDGLAGLVNLELFSVHENKLTGSIGSELVQLPALQGLWLFDNKFTGTLPDLSSSPSTLAELYLNGNELTGNLEDLLATAPSSLETIDLSQNSRLQGSISTEIGRFTSLKSFNVSYCSLDGSLPGSSLGPLASVELLAVAGNELSNTIPSEIGKMQALRVLDLSRNAFSGDIPSEIRNLSSLASLDVSYNPFLSGNLNPIICDGGTIDITTAVADCADDFMTTVKCDCCTACCSPSYEQCFAA